MKIAVVVHGRFHAFDLARSLIARGHDVSVLTNYPRWAVQRFGIPARRVQSFWPHGLLARAAWSLRQRTGALYPEAALHTLFGRWSARVLAREPWDVVHLWSGVAEESLRLRQIQAPLKLMMRGSAHIRTQSELLRAEEARTGTKQDQPSAWMIAREEREYQAATRIVTLSSFARQSFLARGFDPRRLACLPLAASAQAFRPRPEVVAARRQRILSGEKLRVLFVGALSFQKGLWDLRAIVDALNRDNFSFRFVGPSTPEARALVAAMKHQADFVAKRPQSELPDWYARSDVFLFPTIQDGFATVLAQAHAAALPILTTLNSGGPDLLQEGSTGWLLPIRSPQAFVDRLRWCDAHRPELAAMVERLYVGYRPRDWDDVAVDFEQICLDSPQRLAVT